MRKITFIFSLLITQIGISQVCDSIPDGVMNCVDQNGMKQGSWETRQYRDGISCVLFSMDTPVEDRTKAYRQASTVETSRTYRNNIKEGQWIKYFDNGHPKSLGKYSKGIKTGLWKYYKTHVDSSIVSQEIIYEIENEISIEKSRVKYGFDGESISKVSETTFGKEFHSQRDYPNQFYIISTDSLTINGENNRNGVLVNFKCYDKKCQFLLPNGEELLQFTFNEFNDFDFENYKLTMGMYDRQITNKTKR